MTYDEWNRQQVAKRVTAAYRKPHTSRTKRIAIGVGLVLKSVLFWLGP